jgi:hypothetical protein
LNSRTGITAAKKYGVVEFGFDALVSYEIKPKSIWSPRSAPRRDTDPPFSEHRISIRLQEEFQEPLVKRHPYHVSLVMDFLDCN